MDAGMNGTNALPALNISSVKKNNTVINSSIMFAIGFLSNLLALVFLYRSGPEIKRKLFYRLVAGLALTDLIGTTMTSPVVIAVYVNDFRWIGGDPMCKYFAFMMILAGAATMTIVCLMSIERLLCVRKPFLYYTRLRKKHATFFLLGAWTFAAVIASLPLMGFGEIILQYPYTWCFFDYYTKNALKRGFNYLFALLALVMISVTVTCNCIVLFTLFRTKMRGINRKPNTGYSRRYAECQMAVLLIGITVVFSTCYAPLMVRIVINQTGLLPIDMKTDLLMIRFASMNQILDPWVYILLRREVVWTIVRPLKSIFSKLCGKGDDTNNELSASLRPPKSEENHHQTCCIFCFHCLCEPPQDPKRRQSSLLYSESVRYPMLRRSQQNPTQTLVRDLAQNYSNLLIVNPSAVSRNVSADTDANGLLSSTDSHTTAHQTPGSGVITQQPTDVRVSMDPYAEDLVDSAFDCDSNSY